MDALQVAEHMEIWGHKNGSGIPGSGWNKAPAAPPPERSIPRYPKEAEVETLRETYKNDPVYDGD